MENTTPTTPTSPEGMAGGKSKLLWIIGGLIIIAAIIYFIASGVSTDARLSTEVIESLDEAQSVTFKGSAVISGSTFELDKPLRITLDGVSAGTNVRNQAAQLNLGVDLSLLSDEDLQALGIQDRTLTIGLILLQEDMYLHVGSLNELFGAQESWIKFPTTDEEVQEISDTFGVPAEQLGLPVGGFDGYSNVGQKFEKDLIRLIEKSHVVDVVSMEPGDDMEGETTTVYMLALNEEGVLEFLEGIIPMYTDLVAEAAGDSIVSVDAEALADELLPTEEELQKALDSIDLDAAVTLGDESKLPYLVDIMLDIMDPETGRAGTVDISFSFSDYNKEVNIEAPESFITYLELIQSALGGMQVQ